MARTPRGRVGKRSPDASEQSVRIRAVAEPAQRQHADDPFPVRVEPCVPTLVSVPPAGERGWQEIKWDGYGLIAFLRDEKVCLRTRRGNDWTDRFPTIATALR